MKVLLLSRGSRGDVQPLLALATELRVLGHEICLCALPNFKRWVESFGFPYFPQGAVPRPTTSVQSRMSPEEKEREFHAWMLHDEFRTLTEVVRGQSLVLSGCSLAARSVAEAFKIPHIFVDYSPARFPSPGHSAPLAGCHYSETLPTSTNLALWAQCEQIWNDFSLAAINEEHMRLGLAPVESVLRHMLTDRPWLAADPALGPAVAAPGIHAVQTGAWLMGDPSPLPESLVSFLTAGPPPVYLGFGSMRAVEHSSRVLIEAVRALGLRSIISRGWANLMPIDPGTDCLSIGDVSHESLFPHVAAVVHHGGAGTTTAAARAGKPQIIVPHGYDDQPYWAYRVQQLGVGTGAGPTIESLTVDGLVSALCECLRPEVSARAQQLAPRIQLDGARLAARSIDQQFA